MTKVSIIIVNWNVCEQLRDCLNSIFQYTDTSRCEIEVIVVDNASKDSSVTMIQKEFAQVQLIASDINHGFAKGCNLGFAIASGDFILLLNPDTRLLGDLVNFMLRKMQEDASIGALGCRMIDDLNQYRQDSGGFFPTLKNVAWNFLFIDAILPKRLNKRPFFLEEDPQGNFDVQWISGADLFMRREALQGSLFDESFFMYGEDLDLCRRIALNGWRLLYTSDHTLIHNQGSSIKKQESIGVLKNLHKGPRKFLKKNNGIFTVRMYDLIMLTGFLIRWPVYSILSVFIRNRDYHERAVFSRKYLGVLFNLMLGED